MQGQQNGTPRLDNIILDSVEDRILPPDRVRVLLEKLMARRAEFAESVDVRLQRLRSERQKVETAIANLYRLAETGELGIDEGLSARIQELRGQKTKREGTIERIVSQSSPVAHLDPEMLEAFSRTLKEKLHHGDPVLRRNYLGSVVGRVTVGDERILIVRSTQGPASLDFSREFFS